MNFCNDKATFYWKRSLDVFFSSFNYAPYWVEYLHWVVIQMFSKLGVSNGYQYDTL